METSQEKKDAAEGWRERTGMEGYQELANAIVLQAVKDYRILKQKLREEPLNRIAQARMAEVRKFFRSRWFRQLTDLDPYLLLDKLREEDAS